MNYLTPTITLLVVQLEKERYIDNIDEMLWEGKQDADPNPALDQKVYHYEDDNFNHNEDASFFSPKDVNSSKKSDKESRSSSAVRERSPVPVSPAMPQKIIANSTTKKPVQSIAANSSHSVDVGEDRPSHWNRTRPNTAVRTLNKNTTANKSAKSSKLVSNVIKVAQIPKPKPLPSQPAPLSFGENSRPPSFKPSWLTSASTASASLSGNTSHHTQAVGRTQRISTPLGEERMLIEAIQEEAEEYPEHGSYSSTFRPPPRNHALQIEETGLGGDYEVPFQDSSFGSPQGQRAGRYISPQRSITVHTLSTPHTAAPSMSHSYYEHDSGVKLARSHSSSSHGRVSGAKAKAGSLKARLQKVWRDTDANENRIINIPLDPQNNSKSRALDLQDPRSRAVHYIDAQVDQILPDEAPFKVALLSVLGTWRKHKAMDVSDAVSVVSNPTAPSNTTTAPAVGTLLATVPTSPVEVEMTLGALVKGYFKADTCVGSGRGLVEDALLRVYDPHVWSVRTACRSSRDGEGSTAWDYVMINTNCWELVDLNA